MRVQAFQQEIYLNTAKIELVFRQGEALIEKSEPLDAAVIEEELEELQRYCQEVFGRVDRYYKKLTRLPVSEQGKSFRTATYWGVAWWRRGLRDSCLDFIVKLEV